LTAAGDAIMAIDEEPCHSLPTLEVAARLRGRVGSRVIVTMSLSLNYLSVLHSRPLVPACTQQPSTIVEEKILSKRISLLHLMLK
jgi:hypothetical protein